MGSSMGPFLYNGVIFANFRSDGTLKRQQEELGQEGQKNMHRIKTTTLAGGGGAEGRRGGEVQAQAERRWSWEEGEENAQENV